VTKFQVWAGNLQGHEFDDKSSYIINPTIGVLTVHWPDGRLSHYSPSAWQRIEDEQSAHAHSNGAAS